MNEALLSLLDKTPEDHTTWDVLADWLEERDDPRAELMRLTRDREFPGAGWKASETRQLTAALERTRAEWFPFVEVNKHQLTWRHGFITTMRLHDGEQEWARRGAHPAMRYVRDVSLTRFASWDWKQHRHLKRLRCSRLTPAVLKGLPRLDVLLLLNSADGEGRLNESPPPKMLIIDQAWLASFADRKWARKLGRVRLHVSDPETLTPYRDTLLKLPDLKILGLREPIERWPPVFIRSKARTTSEFTRLAYPPTENTLSSDEERELGAASCFACGNPDFEFVSSRREHHSTDDSRRWTDSVIESWCAECGTTSYVLKNNRS